MRVLNTMLLIPGLNLLNFFFFLQLKRHDFYVRVLNAILLLPDLILLNFFFFFQLKRHYLYTRVFLLHLRSLSLLAMTELSHNVASDGFTHCVLDSKSRNPGSLVLHYLIVISFQFFDLICLINILSEAKSKFLHDVPSNTLSHGTLNLKSLYSAEVFLL